MKNNQDSSVSLELPDIIRVNQLVRDQIDFEGFQEWYDSLSAPAQAALITTLCEFAFQAGADEEIYKEALIAATLDAGNPLVVQAKSFHKPYEVLNLFGLRPWLVQLDKVERFTVFKMYIYLFGTAEGRVFQREAKEGCNHWWHRDLLDERVVQALLNDPQYWRTSMKDDDLIKKSMIEIGKHINKIKIYIAPMLLIVAFISVIILAITRTFEWIWVALGCLIAGLSLLGLSMPSHKEKQATINRFTKE